MPPVARLTDRTMGFCLKHKAPLKIGGTIITGSPTTYANGLPVARLGDQVLTDCKQNHKGNISTASPKVYANGIPVARLGDQVSGDYIATIITASGNTFADG